jgi:hypothetical protein
MKYRIVHSRGGVEFSAESDAIAYRDANHPGCAIVPIPYTPPADPPQE